MRIDAFIRAVCHDLQEMVEIEREDMYKHYGNFVQYNGATVTFDIPVLPDASGVNVRIAKNTSGAAAWIKFSLTVRGKCGNGPADGAARLTASRAAVADSRCARLLNTRRSDQHEI
jgi:hypothetical protein